MNVKDCCINGKQTLNELASAGPYGPFLAIQRPFNIRFYQKDPLEYMSESFRTNPFRRAAAILDFFRLFSSEHGILKSRLSSLTTAFKGRPMSNQGYCRTPNDLPYRTRPLDPPSEAPLPILAATIRLLDKDKE